ncbi:MAG: hypothetical protein NDJ94_04900 [Vicinamibacteria bacterium]|nr:hypothetical protein [Vicinamibacteria bacterium]
MDTRPRWLRFDITCLAVVCFGIGIGVGGSALLERWTNPLPLDVTLIAFNDFHGQLDGRELTWEGVPAGGIDWMAAHVEALAARQHHHVLVSAGDLVGASPRLSALFHDEPTIEAMNQVGLSYAAVGRHELAAGPRELLRLQHGGCAADDPDRSCQGAAGRFTGARFRYLAANVVAAETGRALVSPYAIRKFDGIPVAFVGVTLAGPPPAGTPLEGLRFLDEAGTVNALVPTLREKGVESMVVLLNDGGRPARGSVDQCLDFDGPVARVVAALDDEIDLVLTGRTHAAYNCRLPNAAGRDVPVTGAGSYGRVLTSVDLTLDRRSRDVRVVVARNQLVEHRGVRPAAPLTRLVEHYRQRAAAIPVAAEGASAW